MILKSMHAGFCQDNKNVKKNSEPEKSEKKKRTGAMKDEEQNGMGGQCINVQIDRCLGYL